jgi:hypothetical protein
MQVVIGLWLSVLNHGRPSCHHRAARGGLIVRRYGSARGTNFSKFVAAGYVSW